MISCSPFFSMQSLFYAEPVCSIQNLFALCGTLLCLRQPAQLLHKPHQ